jgi:hypothetical protein
MDINDDLLRNLTFHEKKSLAFKERFLYTLYRYNAFQRGNCDRWRPRMLKLYDAVIIKVTNLKTTIGRYGCHAHQDEKKTVS